MPSSLSSFVAHIAAQLGSRSLFAGAKQALPFAVAVALFGLTALLFPPVASAACEAPAGSDVSGFEQALSKYGIGGALAMSFGAGVAASLTPCVWPMVPITVSIFGATEAKSRAKSIALSSVYVLGIVCLFTPLGLVAALTGKGMGAAMTIPAVVVGIALLFFALAASMFGAFELALPSSITNKMSNAGGVGFKGAFTLGLALGLVAAPCTGPFLTGLLIKIGESRNVGLGAAAMACFSLGLGVPFFLAGAFALNLPKGGAWMMGIKWASGVVLAYMGLSYLRDRWPAIFSAPLLKSTNTLFMVGLVILLVGLAAGITHVVAERRKSPIAHLSKRMKLASIGPAVLGLYAVLSLREQAFSTAHAAESSKNAPMMVWNKDEASASAQARVEKKPMVLDFGATSWCEACRELEHKTWPAPVVRNEGQRFVAVNIDCNDDEDPKVLAAAKKYNVSITRLPVVILLDSEGKEKARFTEFVPPEKMADAMCGVR
jgi:thioredoxin:protein disulfide reductase